MSGAVTVSSLMMMTLIVSEESLARDTHMHTDRLRLSTLKVAYNFENKKREGVSICFDCFLRACRRRGRQ